jgi:hypothetical protein
VLVEEHRVVVVAGWVQAVFGEIGGQDRCRVGQQGGVSCGLSRSERPWRVFEADVADGEVGEFLDSGGGVVERGEQGRVASAAVRLSALTSAVPRKP